MTSGIAKHAIDLPDRIMDLPEFQGLEDDGVETLDYFALTERLERLDSVMVGTLANGLRLSYFDRARIVRIIEDAIERADTIAKTSGRAHAATHAHRSIAASLARTLVANDGEQPDNPFASDVLRDIYDHEYALVSGRHGMLNALDDLIR